MSSMYQHKVYTFLNLLLIILNRLSPLSDEIGPAPAPDISPNSIEQQPAPSDQLQLNPDDNHLSEVLLAEMLDKVKFRQFGKFFGYASVCYYNYFTCTSYQSDTYKYPKYVQVGRYLLSVIKPGIFWGWVSSHRLFKLCMLLVCTFD